MLCTHHCFTSSSTIMPTVGAAGSNSTRVGMPPCGHLGRGHHVYSAFTITQSRQTGSSHLHSFRLLRWSSRRRLCKLLQRELSSFYALRGSQQNHHDVLCDQCRGVLVPGALPPFYPLRESQQNHRDTSSPVLVSAAPASLSPCRESQQSQLHLSFLFVSKGLPFFHSKTM